MVKRDWFPDFVADWYDAFEPTHLDSVVRQWKRTPLVEEVPKFEDDLVADPHAAAREIDEWIHRKGGTIALEERNYRALQAANGAIGFVQLGDHLGYHGGNGWEAIRDRFEESGNLLKDAAGLLLPTRRVGYRWATRRARRKDEDIRSHFAQFIRWKSRSDDPKNVEVRVMDAVGVPIEDLEERLVIGFVPLVAAAADFRWVEVDKLFGERRFRVSIVDPSPLKDAAVAAVENAGKQGCDVVVMPELCLTEEIQNDVVAATKKTFAAHGHPWLVVAGSAHTLVTPGKKSDFHNRSRLFDGHGNEIITYNKLHRYQISTREIGRYALDDALASGVPRNEDIDITPRTFPIVDTPIGRVAVLICEDLSRESFVAPLIEALDLDWLLVPVLDGCQTTDRWTARYAYRYAERQASVVVVTSMSLYAAHLDSLNRSGIPLPVPNGIGLVARSRQGNNPQLDVVAAGSSHGEICLAVVKS